MARPEVKIYTDGACSGNPGAGGWGAILIFGSVQKEISGAHEHTTNNRMELTAVIEGLEALNTPCDVTIYSDSAYVVNAINQNWLSNWQKNKWLNSSKQAVSNKDLWEKLLILLDKHNVKFIKVKGHADNELNNRADALAVQAINQFRSE